LVTAVLREGPPVTGRLVAADDDGVTLEVEGSTRVLPHAGLVRGEVQVEFSRKDEPPLEDELDEDEDEDEEDAR
jgi:ribosome maturation factor RimP